jgi:PAS domain S-box-containing protein
MGTFLAIGSVMTDSMEKLRIKISELERQAAQWKRAEDALSASERRLRQIIEFLPDATFVIDTEGKVTAWNKAMQTLTGIKASDMLGKGDFFYAVPFYGKPRPILIDMVIARDQEMASSYPFFHKEGDRLVLELRSGWSRWIPPSLTRSLPIYV